MASLFPDNRVNAAAPILSPGLNSGAAPVLATEPHEPDETPESAKEQRIWRFGLLAFLFILLTSLVLARLVVYQIFRVGELLPYDPDALTPPTRGAIVDRKGDLLTADHFLYQIIATPNELKSDAVRQQVVQRLQEATGLPAAQTLQTLLTYANYGYAEIGEPLAADLGQRVQTMLNETLAADPLSPLRYIAVRPVPERYYPQNSLASHILGFTQADRNGAYGVEEYYDAFLNERGKGLLEPPSGTFAALPPPLQRFLPSAAGKDLVLTVDRGVQWIVEEELRSGIAKYGAKGGTIIVMEPQTGAVLAMANWPDYNPNQRSADATNFSRFMNVAVSAIYEPGSVFKIITMAAGLDTGVITPTTVMTDSGYIIVGQRSIYNSDRRANGQVNMTQALARSLNVITAQVADQVGREDFYRYVRRFGFGDRTGIDLADEVPGLLKTPGQEDWSLSDLGTNSFGQGLAVTPLQMVNATAAIANGGKLMRPYVVQARLDGEQVLYTQPEVLTQAIRPETARDLTEMMVETVDTGNSAARVPGYRIAGKSGTAQIPTLAGYLKDATIVTFVGFAPADDPKFVLLIKLDQPDPAISTWAAYTAAPVFSLVSRRLFDHLGIAPDEIRAQAMGVPVAGNATPEQPVSTGD